MTYPGTRVQSPTIQRQRQSTIKKSVEIVTIWISDIPRSVSKEELRTKWHIQ